MFPPERSARQSAPPIGNIANCESVYHEPAVTKTDYCPCASHLVCLPRDDLCAGGRYGARPLGGGVVSCRNSRLESGAGCLPIARFPNTPPCGRGGARRPPNRAGTAAPTCSFAANCLGSRTYSRDESPPPRAPRNNDFDAPRAYEAAFVPRHACWQESCQRIAQNNNTDYSHPPGSAGVLPASGSVPE
jgi:hypothetical protein